MFLRRLLISAFVFFATPVLASGIDGIQDMLWAKELWAKALTCKRGIRTEDPYQFANYVTEQIYYWPHGASQPNTYHATHVIHVMNSNELTLPIFEHVRDIAPSHRAALDTYYGIATQGRGFSDSRMDWITQVEKLLPLERVKIYQVRDVTTGELYGAIRIFEANVMISTPGNQKFADGNFLAPLERSLILRGTSTDVIQKIRDQHPKAFVYEFGKAFRTPNAYGVVAKASWEMSMISKAILAEYSEGGFIFMHTDRAGAILYQREYGAKVVQSIQSGKDGKLHVLDQTAVLKQDATDAEYILMADTETFVRTVLSRFEKDPDRKKLMEYEYFKQRVSSQLNSINEKLETRKMLQQFIPPREATDPIDYWKNNSRQ